MARKSTTLKAAELPGIAGGIRDVGLVVLVMVIWSTCFRGIFDSRWLTIVFILALWGLLSFVAGRLAHRMHLRFPALWYVAGFIPMWNLLTALVLYWRYRRVLTGFGVKNGRALRQLAADSPEESREIDLGFTYTGLAVYLVLLAGSAYLLTGGWLQVADKNGRIRGEQAFLQKDYRKVLELLRPEAEKGNRRAAALVGYSLLWGPEELRDGDQAEKYLKAAADAEPLAALWLGQAYYQGAAGLPQNPILTARYLKKAAAGELPLAWNEYGICLQQGIGVAPDPQQAAELFQRAADGGHAMAALNLGNVHLLGLGLPVDRSKAVRYYRKAVDLKAPGAKSSLGSCYLYGWGVEKDIAKGIRLIREEAKEKNPTALVLLGVAYANGLGVPQDTAKAIECYTEAAKTGNMEAEYLLGAQLLNDPGRRAEGVKWLVRAADRNEANAINRLGICYDNGIGVAKNPEKALELYRKAATFGLPIAIFNVGITLFGQPGHEQEGIALMQKAVTAGSPDAMLQLGRLYVDGHQPLKADPVEAFRLFGLAAQQNVPEAFLELARCHALGIGTPEDLGKAKECYRKAQGAGVEGAAEELRELERQAP